MTSGLDGDCLLRLALCNSLSPQKLSHMEKKSRPLGERMCVYKYTFKHVKRLFSEATKVRKWVKTAKKKLYSLNS